MRRVFFFVLCGFLMSSASARAPTEAINSIAEKYAHLVLALGQHDPDYVDAFYGPAEWKTQAEKEQKSLDAIGAEAAELRANLNQDRLSPSASAELRRDKQSSPKPIHSPSLPLDARASLPEIGRASCRERV